MHCDIVLATLLIVVASVSLSHLKLSYDDPTNKVSSGSCNLRWVSHEINAVLWIVFERERASMGHIAGLPEVKERLAVLQQIWIPIYVQAVEVLHHRVEIHPKNTFVLREIVISERLFQLWRPA